MKTVGINPWWLHAGGPQIGDLLKRAEYRKSQLLSRAMRVKTRYAVPMEW